MSEDANTTVDGGHLRQFVDRVMKLEDDKDVISEDISEVYKELKGVGFDPKIVRKIVAALRKDKAKREEEQSLLQLYAQAIGQLDLFA
jgi:uncharacterized protein (UPF0335 family)